MNSLICKDTSTVENNCDKCVLEVPESEEDFTAAWCENILRREKIIDELYMQEKENRFFSCNSCTTPCAFNTTILSLKTSHCPPANLIGFNCNVLTMTPARQKSTDNNMTRRARQRGDVVIALLATSGVGKSDSDSSCSVRDRPPDL